GGPMGRRGDRRAGDLNYFALHHAGVHEVHPDQDPGVLMKAFARDGIGDGNYYIVYQLGANETIYPSDTGVIMRAGSQFTFSVHLHSIGKEVKVRLDVALKFRPKTFKPRFNQQIFTFVGDSEEPELDIPANTDKVRFDAYFTMPKNGLITTFEPHMHS